MAPMQVALFDLDGTITRHDTLFPYVLRVCLRHPGRLLRVLRRMPGALLRYAFAGMSAPAQRFIVLSSSRPHAFR